jgi:predicted Zn-dependent peptidase
MLMMLGFLRCSCSPMVVWKFKGANDKESDILDVIEDMLSNGKAGLMEVDLEQQMKLASAGAFVYGLHDYSAFILAGNPNKGQKLEEVRSLMLQEMAKLRRGEFDNDLLPSVIANKKLNFYRGLDSNDNRASIMVDAFINDEKWEDVASKLERQSKLTKQDIVDFANKYLRDDNFICVYKQMGEDTTLKKIEKPAITPIPANREYESAFVKEIKNAQVPEIQPQFLDFKKDLTVGKTSRKLPLVYKQNTQDDLFNLVFRYEFGDEDDIRYSYAAQYLDYIGTDKKSVSAIKQAFYKLACNFSIAQSSKTLQISLNGLNENLPAALRLTEEILHHAKADKTSWNQFIDLIEKQQQDAKTNQMSNFSYLWDYSTYGAYNPTRNAIKTADLRKMDPQELVNLLGGLNNIEHTVAYYGPYSEKQLNALLAKEHKTAKKLAAVPEGKEYKMEEIKQNEIYIAPYDAKNIYLRSYQNTGKKSDVKDGALISLFNEYYGGGMNTIVFQELRETRGLAYNAGAAYYTPVRKDEKDYFMRHIITQNDKMMDCIHVFDEITDNLPQNEASFNLAKQNLMKSIQSRRVTKAGVINAYFNAKLRGIDYDVTKLYYEQIPSLTLQDITNFEKQNIVGKPYRMVILGDEKNLDMKSLEKIAPIKRLSQEEIFGY